MAVVITLLTPPRGRETDTLVIDGTGFAAANNAVTIDGVTATISVESTVQITVTVPALAGGKKGFQVPVEVVNQDNSERGELFWLFERDVATIETEILVAQQPDTVENVNVEAPTIAEAKDAERWVSNFQTWFLVILARASAGVQAGAEKIGTQIAQFVNFVATRATVQGALEGIDTVFLGLVSVNVETLAADKALVDGDKFKHYLDCGGTSRKVSVPTAASTNHDYYIENTSDVFELIYVVDDDGLVLAILEPGQSDVVRSDRTGAWDSEKFGKVGGRGILHFGNNTSGADQLMRAGGGPADTALAIGSETQPDQSYTVPFQGEMLAASVASPASSFARSIRLFREGDSSSTEVFIESTVAAVSISLQVFDLKSQRLFAADERAAFGKFSLSGGDSHGQLLYRQRGGATKVGACVPFGANLSTTTNYARANGTASSAQVAAAGPLTSQPMPIAGNAVYITWNVNTSGGTVRVHNITAATSVDVVLSGTGTGAAASLAFAAGDVLAIEYLSGTAPGISNFLLWTDIPGIIYSFGGDADALSKPWDVCGEADDVLDTGQTIENVVPVLESGTLKAVGWNVTTDPGGSGDLKVISAISGNELEFLDDGFTGTNGADESFTKALQRGEAFYIEQTAGTVCDEGIITLLIGPNV